MFTADCHFAFESALPEVGNTAYDSAADFVAAVANRQADSVSIHQGHSPEITFLAPDVASAVWAMEDLVHRPRGVRPSFHGWGRYFDRYARVDGEWKISNSRLVRQREELL